MDSIIQLGEIEISVTRKDVKNVHLSVHPPAGRVTMVTPTNTRREVARAYAVSRLGWIREQQAKLIGQLREAPRQYVERETHYLWGRRYLLSVVERDDKPSVRIGHRKITLSVRPGTGVERREEIMQEWGRAQLHETLPPIISKWESKLRVRVSGYFLQRMKTKWGSCNHRARTIRLNTELAKKPKDLVEYVVVHEMIHLIEPTHSARFSALMARHWPSWREARLELNDLPLGAALSD